MKNVLFFFLVSLFAIGQDRYIKNEHVEITSCIKNNNYVIDYLFQDEQKNMHTIEIVFNQGKVDSMIKKFGFPTSILKQNNNTKGGFEKRNKIIKDGFFLIDGNIIEKDKKSLVQFYKETVSQVADYIIDYLVKHNQDTRENRIELAMKFVQDIPYAIPKENKRIYKNEYITPPEVLIEGYGDCDSKTILFVCIMSFLIDVEDILFVSIPGHIFAAIKEDLNDSNSKLVTSGEYIPYTQRDLSDTRNGQYVEYNGKKYFICETAGPGRPNYGDAYKYQSIAKKDSKGGFLASLRNILDYIPATSMNRPISTIKNCKIETFDLSESFSFFGNCYHSNHMKKNKDANRFGFDYHSCYMFNPPTSYDATKPVD